MIVKAMTFNIQHGLDYKELLNKKRIINLDKVCDLIKQNNPDIVCLNEVYNDTKKLETVDQTKYIANKLGYQYYYFGKAITIKESIEYGNALLSKYPIIEASIHMIDDPSIKDEDVYYETRNVIESQINIAGTIINVFVTHVGLAKQEQNNAIKKIMTLLEKVDQDNVKTILMGDFNMEESNSNIIQLIKYIDNTSYLIKGNKKTYPSIKPTVKIDYIFSKGLEILESEVVKEVVSDHFPIISKMKFN